MICRDHCFASPSTARLRVLRGGHNIIRSARLPKPIVLVDTRERAPLPLHANHPNLTTERAASWLSQHFTYWLLEQHGLGRILIDSDGV